MFCFREVFFSNGFGLEYVGLLLRDIEGIGGKYSQIKIFYWIYMEQGEDEEIKVEEIQLGQGVLF